MAKLDTLDKLESKLNHDLASRKKELTQIKFIWENNKDNHAINKAVILLFYAHWEGFIKTAAINYLNFLNTQRLLCKQLQECFSSLQLGKELDHSLVIGKYRHRQDIIMAIRQLDDKEFDIIPEKVIATKSNLNSEVLKEILHQIGLDENMFATKHNLIDEKLLGYRNPIAHGDYRELLPTQTIVTEVSDHIISMITEFKDAIVRHAEDKKYLKSAPQAGKSCQWESLSLQSKLSVSYECAGSKNDLFCCLPIPSLTAGSPAVSWTSVGLQSNDSQPPLPMPKH